MPSTQQTVDFITGQMNGRSNVRSRAMFGEYAVYCDDKVVALVCDDRLFLKVTDAGAALLSGAELGSPYPGAKPAFIVPEDIWDDTARMTALVQATADALPTVRHKK